MDASERDSLGAADCDGASAWRPTGPSCSSTSAPRSGRSASARSGITGHVDAVVSDGEIDTTTPPSAHLEIAVEGLRSGNSLYDAELLRRIDARRHSRRPRSTSPSARPGASRGRYSLSGDLEFHGVVRPAHGTVTVEVVDESRLVVTGEQVFDIRDFDVPSPTVLMLRIYPDVRVHLHVEAELEEG